MAYCHCGSPATVIEAAGTSIARTASYEYDFQGKRWKTTTPEGSMSIHSISYGGLISSSGPLAGANTMRFSSKPAILSATGAWGFYYYGYWFYEPGMQRWLNRDPIEERGGWNIYGFLGNDTMARIDPNGLIIWVFRSGNCLRRIERWRWEAEASLPDCEGITDDADYYVCEAERREKMKEIADRAAEMLIECQKSSYSRPGVFSRSGGFFRWVGCIKELF